jgi:hypothetical protein
MGYTIVSLAAQIGTAFGTLLFFTLLYPFLID